MTENEQYEDLGEFNEEGLRNIGVRQESDRPKRFGDGLFSSVGGPMTPEDQTRLLDVNMDVEAPSIWSVLGVASVICVAIWVIGQFM